MGLPSGRQHHEQEATDGLGLLAGFHRARDDQGNGF